MWNKLFEWLIGCPRCQERSVRIKSLERDLKDLMDRFMSRDFSSFNFNKPKPEEPKRVYHSNTEGAGDGLDEVA